MLVVVGARGGAATGKHLMELVARRWGGKMRVLGVRTWCSRVAQGIRARAERGPPTRAQLLRRHRRYRGRSIFQPALAAGVHASAFLAGNPAAQQLRSPTDSVAFDNRRGRDASPVVGRADIDRADTVQHPIGFPRRRYAEGTGAHRRGGDRRTAARTHERRREQVRDTDQPRHEAAPRASTRSLPIPCSETFRS